MPDSLKSISGPPGTWIGGNLRGFGAGPLQFLTDTARDYGGLAKLRFGWRQILLVSDPDLIEQVLVTDARHYIKHFGTRIYKPLLGKGLLTSEGETWLRQRRLSQPAFSKSRIQSYAPAMSELTTKMLKRWNPGLEVDVHQEFSSLSSEIALKTLFDLDDPNDQRRFTESLRLAIELMSARLHQVVKIPKWLPLPSNIRRNRALQELDTVVAGFIAAGRARQEPGHDLLSLMIAAQDEDGSRMSDRQLRDEMMTMYIGGHETSALTLAWTWYLLSQNPEVEAKLVAEWDRVLQGRTPAVDDLPNLPYTDAVLWEAMRIYPPAYLIGREAVRDLELGGCRVKKGCTIFMSQWVNHRDARYFPDPEKFLPERWENGLAARIPKYAYYPFGGGPRVCIGQKFALMQLAIILATVGQQYRFTLKPGARIDVNPQITLVPAQGIPVTLVRRT